MIIRREITVFGTVQGVGFRPFVYRLAHELQLAGSVRNDGFGVTIEIEGESAVCERFCELLASQKPPLSIISSIKKRDLTLQNETDFTIVNTARSKRVITNAPPDTALCDDCAKELFDPLNRRYRHPFISCTNCGPRYTILTRLPYDRAETSMRSFTMCEACAAEYSNPIDRRFHAQPNACHHCGSTLTLYDASGQTVAVRQEAIRAAVYALRNGKIVAIKALGGFHLCAIATNETVVKRLRERKNRPSKPLAVLFGAIETIEAQAQLSDEARELIASSARPIVLVRKSDRYSLAPSVAPAIDRIGVMLPSSPLEAIIMNDLREPIVATSANISNEPIICNLAELTTKLGAVYDLALDHDREIVNACDDSVVMETGVAAVMVRRARGYAPTPFALAKAIAAPTLALGAQQKSAIAIGFDKNAVLSPHIGDLGSVDSLEFFDRTIATFKRLYAFEPKRIVCDLHPRYDSVKWALAQQLPTLQVQHHHAHALAVMAERRLASPALAIVWDGTGYGTDGTIWGGEFLVADYARFDRVAHIKPFGLIGGESAIREPQKIAYALLHQAGLSERLDDKNLAQMVERGINTPQTSSIGRLFDAVAYLIGACREFGFEGQSGMTIEALYDERETRSYPFEITNGAIGVEPMIRALLSDPPQIAASRFINTLAAIALEVVRGYDLPIVLCGGVFQNRVLVEKLVPTLRSAGKTVYLPRLFPPNDGAIALGQLAYDGE
ncbi:carbamoyltransferase [Campylobacterota bacterium]|nr:carbamoyltransferase [Campylobacterota bacterium]